MIKTVIDNMRMYAIMQNNMKRIFKSLLACFFVLSVLIINQVQVFAWSSSSSSSKTNTHLYLVKNSSYYTSSNFTTNEKSVLSVAISVADNGNYTHSSKGSVHGGGNYVLCLRYLYTVAYYLNQDNSLDTSFELADTDMTSYGISDSALGKSATDIKDGDSNIGNMKLDIYKIINSNLVVSVGESNNRMRAIKVLGLALHLGGDIYAHRTTVPVDSIAEFEQSDFTTTQYKAFKEAIDKGTLKFVSINNYTTTSTSTKYEDNVKFFSSRYFNATKFTTNMLLKYFINNKEWGLSIILPWTQNSSWTDTFTTTSGAVKQVTMKLINFSTYVEASGYGSNYLSKKYGLDPTEITAS